jgi:syntaxin 1B/2/3
MQNIEDMHQMFLDLAVLVHHQGEMLDTIEKHVDTAVNYVEKAGKALEAAKDHQKSARWVNPR